MAKQHVRKGKAARERRQYVATHGCTNVSCELDHIYRIADKTARHARQ